MVWADRRERYRKSLIYGYTVACVVKHNLFMTTRVHRNKESQIYLLQIMDQLPFVRKDGGTFQGFILIYRYYPRLRTTNQAQYN